MSLYVWRVPAAAVPAALWRMAVDPRRVRRQPGVRFVKLLGTGRDSRFGPASPDPTRWAALAVYDGDRPEFPGWARHAIASCRLDLAPLAAHGSWAGHRPFRINGANDAEGTETPILALTRARLRPTRAATFWRAIGPVAAAASHASGLLAAFGVGEAPLGWQGTITLWRRPADLFSFAYRHPQHRQAIEWTTTTGWYAEEMFARFAVLNVVGDTGVIGWGSERHAANRPSTGR
ncbi:monooxygenase [Rugosimonospora africana]|uniref:monooxygenase n=1 Tax=Rugosimonospora africana TaxID=556532 RepID=UPI001941E9F2|nr:monooxygenase [Rugosimonospora africana]